MDTVIEEARNGAYFIILNRPERKNALNTELLAALQAALENAGKEGSSVVVIRGSGGSFSVGGDLGEFRELVREGKSLDRGADLLHRCISLIRKLRAVTIAVLEGFVVGGAVGISLACDLSVAVQGAIMDLAYRRIGLTPDGGASLLLPRIIGAKRFNEFYFLARNIETREALALGLVNFVWGKEELEPGLERLIEDVRALPAETIGPFKDLVNGSALPGLENHLDKERRYLSELGQAPGFKERLEAFFAKK